RMAIFMASVCFWMFVPPFRGRRLVTELHFIGVRSIFVISVTALFTGAVLALQGYRTLRTYGAVGLVGSTVAVSLIRGAAPILTAIMVAARAGSAIAAELGVMRITEQIDAIEVMALNPVQYLCSPTVLAGVIAMPLLTAIYDVAGIIGGYSVAVFVL